MLSLRCFFFHDAPLALYFIIRIRFDARAFRRRYAITPPTAIAAVPDTPDAARCRRLAVIFFAAIVACFATLRLIQRHDAMPLLRRRCAAAFVIDATLLPAAHAAARSRRRY